MGLKRPSPVSIAISVFLLLGVLFAGFQWLDQPFSAGKRYFFWNPFGGSHSSDSLAARLAGEHGLLFCANTTAAAEVRQFPPGPSCPDYFRWIHEDLRPWNRSGITREMVESGKKLADFRLVIVGGKAYVETYRRSFQTRDLFTIWGILQLLSWYPGHIPDLDLMFNCGDVPMVPAAGFWPWTWIRKWRVPAPVFHYCADDASQDIVFPDWSFWGWAEVNIKPWKLLVKELRAGNEKTKWKERARTAYWKGNPYVSRTRRDLLKCNLSESHDWNARLYIQNWEEEIQRGFKQSNLADQCTHRYKIYVEGVAWSVSRKYILACDSPTLSMKDRYYDFFSRSLLPGQHFWPISADNKCPSIKFAVDWGNSHPQKAQEIGKAGSSFILNDMRMENVYDYMFHALTEYAKLLRYKPTIPSAAKPVCLESMASSESGRVKEFMIESMVEGPRNAGPCALPPPDSAAVESLTRRKKESVKQVQRWEREGRDRWNKRR
ncbi:uncharacterized protein LOC116253374 isoform X1 [Nymphaea colorata]|uniref:uncharacterized protein LOC116253374 isoform X1 n=1 Tax=Nymphaea colorata TaxID=210225 RepID=UPI00129EFB0D|nr:uncharacterized protein LOC116253374 isoform X1 [Nymphaea colorata]